MEKIKKTNQNSLKDLVDKYYELIKKYAYLLLLIPTIIGGLWQFLGLASLGFEYLRFFSLQQLISDGLTLLFPLFGVMFFVVIFIIISIKGNQEFLRKEKKRIKNIQRKKRFIRFLRMLFFNIILVSILSYYVFSFINKNVGLSTIIPLFYIPLVYLLNSNLDFIDNNFKKETKRIKFYTIIYIPMVLILITSLLMFVMNLIINIINLNNYSVPSNLMNIEYVKENIYEDYGLKENQYEIAYMNDTYIFVEAILLNEDEIKKLKKQEKDIPTKVIIYKTDKLFEKNQLPRETKNKIIDSIRTKK